MKDEKVNELVRKLKLQMHTKGLTQKELSKKAGVSGPYLSNVFRGKASPSLYVFCQLAKALDMEIAVYEPCRLKMTPKEVAKLIR